MNLRHLPPAILLLILTACVTPVVEDNSNKEQLAELQQRIIDMESTITSAIKDSCETNTQALAKEIHQDLRKELASAEKSASRARKKTKEVEKQCRQVQAEKIIFGEVEVVLFEDEELTLDARIDTGAETSSLGVFGMTEFERDGKEWVRFKLKKSKKSPFFEYRIRDDVLIKQRHQDGIEQRYEVKMDVRVGGKQYRRQLFNLADRSHLDFQLILGRSFLKDIAVVDVSLKKQLSKKK